MLSSVEHEKSFITLGPVCLLLTGAVDLPPYDDIMMSESHIFVYTV